MWCCLPQPLSACGLEHGRVNAGIAGCRRLLLPPMHPQCVTVTTAVGQAGPTCLSRAATAAVYLSPFKSSISDSQLSVRSPWFVSTSRRPTALCPSPPQSRTPVQRRVASICSSRLPALHFASSLLPLSQAAASGLLSSFLMPLLKAVSFPSVGRSRRLAGLVFLFPVSNRILDCT